MLLLHHACMQLESTAAIMRACSARGARVCGWLLAGCMLLHALMVNLGLRYLLYYRARILP